MNDNEKDLTNTETVNEDDNDFFKDVLGDPEEEDKSQDVTEDSDKEKAKETTETKDREETEEQKKERSQKNIDAEAKRKRLEAETRAQKALEEKKKQEEVKEKQIDSLGKQLEEFKKLYPDVELKELDNDKSFKKFIDGKLLGKKNFTELYKEYLEVRAELSGKTKETVEANYRKKADASSGSSTSREGATGGAEVYSEEELKRLSAKIPFMHPNDASKVMDKYLKSMEHYQKQK